jgi:hypothetical protein
MQRPKRRRALSLLEVVVAMCLLTAGLVTLGLMIPRCLLHMRNKGFDCIAAQLGSQIIEATRGLDPADVPNGTWDATTIDPAPPPARSGLRTFPPAPYPARDITVNNNNTPVTMHYTFSVKMGPATIAGAPANLRLIEVTVSWTEPDGSGNQTARSYTVASQVGS